MGCHGILNQLTGDTLSTVTIPKGLFFEKTKEEAIKIWEGIERSLQSLIKADPFYGRSFFVFVYLKQEADGTQNRHAYLNIRIVRPTAYPDSALFRIIPKQNRYELLYWLPAEELMNAYKRGGPFENEILAGWIEAFENNMLSDPTDTDFSKEELYRILHGERYGKTQEEMMHALQDEVVQFNTV